VAELILTEEEKQAASWLDFDDASLGRCVKSTAHFIRSQSQKDDPEGGDVVTVNATSLLLVGRAIKSNADTFTTSIYGVTIKGKEVGDWEVVAKRVYMPKEAAESKEEDTRPYTEYVIECQGLSWPQRLQSAWSGVALFFTALFLGRFTSVVRKYHKLTSVRNGNIPIAGRSES